MKFVLEINLDGAAFEYPNYELVRLLERVSADLEVTPALTRVTPQTLRDINGNTCGSWRVVAS